MTQDLQKEMNDEHLDREGFTEEMIPILKAYRGNRMTVEYAAYEIAKLAERHVYKPIETPHTPAKEWEVRTCDCLNGRRGENCLDYHPLISPNPPESERGTG